MPKVTILMSVFNAQQYLGKAIESILDQSLSDFEFIIIDDASTDKSLAIIKSFKDRRIKILRNKKRLGLTASLNKGLRKVKGKFIARMDADDISSKERLKIQFNYFKNNPQVALCGSWVTLINQDGKKIGVRKYPLEYKEIKKVILRYNPFIHPSIMIRKKVLDKVGFYDVNLDRAGDYDLFLRIVKYYQAVNLSYYLLEYRISPKAMSFLNYKEMEQEAIQARWRAITKYGYSWWKMIYLIIPIISFLIPGFMKRFLYCRRFGF